jgi:heat-inducible transcriptional repressor
MSRYPQLSEREESILGAIVASYIGSAEPVGSRAIVKRYGLDLSPATVRNVMADLEESGYLKQLHTSSGRVPTDQGYRYYVDYLMRAQHLPIEERARIERELLSKANDAEAVMREASRLLAQASGQTGIVEAPDEEYAEVRKIELVQLGPTRAVALIADSCGRVRTVMVNLEGTLQSLDVQRVGAFLNDTLRGVAVDKLATTVHVRMRMLMDEQRRLAEQGLRLLNLLPAREPGEVYLEGVTQLFEQPEFRDLSRAREVFALFDERPRLAGLLRRGSETAGSSQPAVVIGSEAHEQGLEEISVVASPYCVGHRTVGALGVLGPRRMPYSRMTALVQFTAHVLGRLLTKLAGDTESPRP